MHCIQFCTISLLLYWKYGLAELHDRSFFRNSYQTSASMLSHFVDMLLFKKPNHKTVFLSRSRFQNFTFVLVQNFH